MGAQTIGWRTPIDSVKRVFMALRPHEVQAKRYWLARRSLARLRQWWFDA